MSQNEWEIVSVRKCPVGKCPSEALSQWEKIAVGNCRDGILSVRYCPVGNCRMGIFFSGKLSSGKMSLHNLAMLTTITL